MKKAILMIMIGMLLATNSNANKFEDTVKKGFKKFVSNKKDGLTNKISHRLKIVESPKKNVADAKTTKKEKNSLDSYMEKIFK